jgi:flagellar motor switch protein FliN
LSKRDSHEAADAAALSADVHPFDSLPRVSHRQVGLENWLRRWTRDGLPAPLAWLPNEIGASIVLDRPEILSRASGLARAGLVAQLTVPTMATRVALGIEIPLAHAIVDRLLGFDRSFAEARLQLTPVEWGVWTFLILRALDSLASDGLQDGRRSPDSSRLWSSGKLTLDRVGPDPFDPTGLGPIMTVRWSARVGRVTGAVRLWLPESMVNLWLAAEPGPLVGHTGSATSPQIDDAGRWGGHRITRGELASSWRAEAGFVTMSQGLKRLRVGGVLPLAESPLTGTPISPSGAVDLILDLEGQDTRFRIPARLVADSGGRLVRFEERILREPRLRDPVFVIKSEGKPMSQAHTQSNPPSNVPSAAPLDVPVTLTVELGRVNLTLAHLADLKAGDIVELSRHSRAPVELTSNGRLVARGELILIDTELGVRVTNVFL